MLNNNDFIVFINYFFAHDERADVGGTGGVPQADGVWDNNDFIVYIDAFFGGC
ncbi:MAG: GC-type dockerin domain-anchored protein [Phycisphaerales bacterium]|nr:GC-type dockerin domain-anchored protein [Phycisphaerales bacterium]